MDRDEVFSVQTRFHGREVPWERDYSEGRSIKSEAETPHYTRNFMEDVALSFVINLNTGLYEESE